MFNSQIIYQWLLCLKQFGSTHKITSKFIIVQDFTGGIWVCLDYPRLCLTGVQIGVYWTFWLLVGCFVHSTFIQGLSVTISWLMIFDVNGTSLDLMLGRLVEALRHFLDEDCCVAGGLIGELEKFVDFVICWLVSFLYVLSCWLDLISLCLILSCLLQLPSKSNEAELKDSMMQYPIG